MQSVSELKPTIKASFQDIETKRIFIFWKHKPDNFSTKNVFKRAWNATHKKPEEKFEASPWVWVICFEVKNDK
jgi:hypothetical protein